MRERLADDRERRADERAREAAGADREAEVNAILAAAQQRDLRADARDHEANRRDVAAALEVAVFGTGGGAKPSEARRMAAKDRGHSKTDRSAAHIDRFLLSGGEPAAEETEDDSATAE
jgi:hypothetical protein